MDFKKEVTILFAVDIMVRKKKELLCELSRVEQEYGEKRSSIIEKISVIDSDIKHTLGI